MLYGYSPADMKATKAAPAPPAALVGRVIRKEFCDGKTYRVRPSAQYPAEEIGFKGREIRTDHNTREPGARKPLHPRDCGRSLLRRISGVAALEPTPPPHPPCLLV